MSEETKGTEIRLENPMAAHYGTFIIGNAQHCDRVVEQNSHKGQTLVICGAGPSLRDNADEYCTTDYVVWGCNSAGPWLLENGYRCDTFYSVDQTPELIGEWVSAPDVDYIISSTSHPNLTEYLLSKNRRLTFHHNYVGINQRPVAYSVCNDCDYVGGYEIPECQNCKSSNIKNGILAYEDWLYMALYPGTIRAGSGLNTVSRAIDVGMFMGFEKIYVLGADCQMTMKSPQPEGAVIGSPAYLEWLRNETVMHANGGSALANNQSPMTLSAVIDPGTDGPKVRRGKGIPVLTKVDLLVTAVFLVEMQRKLKPRVTLVGEGLPWLLRKKNKAFLQRLVAFMGSDGNDRPVEYSPGIAA